MNKSGEKILADIDCTLDQLIKNASAIQTVSLEENELEAMQKTQESLLAKLIHLDKLLYPQNKKLVQKKNSSSISSVQQKLNRFSRLNTRLIQGMSNHFEKIEKKKKMMKKPRIGRNRKPKHLA